MKSLARASTAFVGMLVACALVAAPAMADSCRDGSKKGRHRHASVRHGGGDRDHHRDHDRDHDRKHRHGRNRNCCEKRVVHHAARSPLFGIAIRVGDPVRYVPVRECARPVVYAPVPVARGPYYDPDCQRHFSSFELYVQHVSDRSAAAVHIRN